MNCFQVFMIFGLWHHLTHNQTLLFLLWIAFKFLWSLVFDIRRWPILIHWPVVNCFQVFMIFGLWHHQGKITPRPMVVNCFQVFMIFGLWHRKTIAATARCGCELLSSFYDLWSLTSQIDVVFMFLTLWIAFKFLWSLVFDILYY